MTAAIKVGDLVRIDLPEGHFSIDHKGLWVVVERKERPPFQDYYLILKGTHHLLMNHWHLEKVSE